MFVVPTSNYNHCKDKATIVLMNARSINSQLCGQSLFCLLNSSSTGCLQNKRFLLFGIKPSTTPHKTIQTTTQDTCTSNQIVFINDLQLQEFANDRYMNGTIMHVFDSPGCLYDIIF